MPTVQNQPISRSELKETLSRIAEMPIPRLEKVIRDHPTIKSVSDACLLLPTLSKANQRRLCTSIAKTGQTQLIDVTSAGVLLNGRHRLIACFMLGIEPKLRQIDPDNAVEFVLADQYQRSYNRAARAQIALELETLIKEKARLLDEPAFAAEASKLQSGRRFCVDLDVYFTDRKPLHLEEGESVRVAAIRMAGSTPSAVRRLITLQNKSPDLAKRAVQGGILLRDAERELQRQADCGGFAVSRGKRQVAIRHAAKMSPGIGKLKKEFGNKKRKIQIYELSSRSFNVVCDSPRKRTVVSIAGTYAAARWEGVLLLIGEFSG